MSLLFNHYIDGDQIAEVVSNDTEELFFLLIGLCNNESRFFDELIETVPDASRDDLASFLRRLSDGIQNPEITLGDGDGEPVHAEGDGS
jgi:hypothetical protein